MKRERREKVTYTDVFVAFDGEEFSSEAECKKYEESAYAVLKKAYEPLIIGSTTEYGLYGIGSEDCDIDIIKVNNVDELLIVNKYIQFINHDTSTRDLFSVKDIGKETIIEWSYDRDYVYRMPSISEYIENISCALETIIEDYAKEKNNV